MSFMGGAPEGRIWSSPSAHPFQPPSPHSFRIARTPGRNGASPGGPIGSGRHKSIIYASRTGPAPEPEAHNLVAFIANMH